MSSVILNTILSVVPTPLQLPLALTLIVVFLSWLYITLARGKYDMKTYQVIPGPKSLPMLGNALDINVPPEKFIQCVRELVEKVSIAQFKWRLYKNSTNVAKKSSLDMCIVSCISKFQYSITRI